MLIEAKAAQSSDTFAVAREKLRVGPVPNWVTACTPDYNFVPKKQKSFTSTTILLWNAQTNAESNASHIHMAIRLENMQAVQHESQWRVEFEPKTETVILHWLKVRRGAIEIDHTNIGKIHLLQREAGLEGCVIDGLFTALLVLEDIRPGDVLEWCYTMESQPRLLPENRFAFFRLPSAVPVGKVFLGLRFSESRLMKWKSSSADLKFDETRENNQVIWRCIRENFSSPEPEPDVPQWYLTFPWFQVSDCAEWGAVNQAVTVAWAQTGDESAVASLVEEICTKETELFARVEYALRLVQDEFRYLSVNLDHGGQIPTPPGTVARRRFGDCKDLSLLLMHIFRGLGVTAHPVLVNTDMRRSLAEFLPSPNLFNHVVVQYEIQGEIRWVDVTLKNQGGGPLKRVLPDYGYGLVLNSSAAPLSRPPPASIAPGTLRIQESILLDTTGDDSSVAIVSTAEGSEAEILREQFAKVPLEEISQLRLQQCADRYRNAKRIGELKFRDDRETNEFHIAEIFQVNGFLAPDNEPGFCVFQLPVNLVNGSLRLPESRTRRDPFALPQPCRLIHIYDVQGGGFQRSHSPRSRVESPLVRFSSQVRVMPGSWSVTLTLDILTDVMLANQLSEHSRRVQQIWQDSTWILTVPLGYSAAARNRAFGLLPSPKQPTEVSTRAKTARAPTISSAECKKPEAQPVIAAPTVQMEKWRIEDAGQLRDSTRRRVRRSSRSRSSNSRRKLGPWVIGGIVFAVLFIGLLVLALIAKVMSP